MIQFDCDEEVQLITFTGKDKAGISISTAFNYEFEDWEMFFSKWRSRRRNVFTINKIYLFYYLQ